MESDYERTYHFLQLTPTATPMASMKIVRPKDSSTTLLPKPILDQINGDLRRLGKPKLSTVFTTTGHIPVLYSNVSTIPLKNAVSLPLLNNLQSSSNTGGEVQLTKAVSHKQLFGAFSDINEALLFVFGSAEKAITELKTSNAERKTLIDIVYTLFTANMLSAVCGDDEENQMPDAEFNQWREKISKQLSVRMPLMSDLIFNGGKMSCNEWNNAYRGRFSTDFIVAPPDLRIDAAQLYATIEAQKAAKQAKLEEKKRKRVWEQEMLMSF